MAKVSRALKELGKLDPGVATEDVEYEVQKIYDNNKKDNK
jgi:hypothetical protein